MDNKYLVDIFKAKDGKRYPVKVQAVIKDKEGNVEQGLDGEPIKVCDRIGLADAYVNLGILLMSLDTMDILLTLLISGQGELEGVAHMQLCPRFLDDKTGLNPFDTRDIKDVRRDGLEADRPFGNDISVIRSPEFLVFHEVICF